ncbi:MAG TPA: hypothetical protein VOB72_23170, partial [Candidatus Dormibacteraeota bacterium]|nr:hypothetical protein [Candidatus Dormibacteraeota bacterium]
EANRAAGGHAAMRWFAEPDPVLRVWTAAGPVAPADLRVCDLDAWSPPAAGLAVDPVRGRLVAADARFTPVAIDFAYGFAGDLGGGPYDRRAAVACWLDPAERPIDWLAGVSVSAAAGSTDPYPSVTAAVAAWNARAEAGRPELGVIAVEDSATYDLAALSTIDLPPGGMLAIVAARRLGASGELDASGLRPHLRGDVQARGLPGATPGRLVLDGLLVEGALRLQPGNLGRVLVSHCTLVPRRGVPAVQASGNPDLELDLCRAIAGAVVVVDGAAAVRLADTIVDAVPAPGDVVAPIAIAAEAVPARIDASTVAGATRAQTLDASDSLFTGPVTIARRQTGCVRCCFLPAGSTTPRRFRCQPDTAIARTGAPAEALVRARLAPAFTSLDYGSPGYAQLLDTVAAELRTGAADGSEMGAFSFLKQPQRERNLVAALDEYLPAGLDAGIFHVT